MSHLVWYTYSMNNMKNEMKNNKANNLRLGAVYINATTGAPCRLVNIVPCQGVWLEAYDGQGYGELIKFEDVSYASLDEVQDYIEDLHTYTKPTSVKVDHNNRDEITFRGFVQEDDETYYGCDTITAPDGNDYPIRDYS